MWPFKRRDAASIETPQPAPKADSKITLSVHDDDLTRTINILRMRGLIMPAVTHKDMFNREILVGNYVMSYEHHTLSMFVVEKLTPKMVSVRSIKHKRVHLRYPKDLFVLENEQAVLKLLSD